MSTLTKGGVPADSFRKGLAKPRTSLSRPQAPDDVEVSVLAH